MSEPTQPSRIVDPQERRIRRSWWFFAATFFILGVLVVMRTMDVGAGAIDFLLVGLVVVVGYAAILHRDAVHRLEIDRRGEAESFTRILQGLSRSVSPDAIVSAIVEELGVATGADHVVVVRRRPEANELRATLVSARAGVPSSTTRFPLSDIEDPEASWRADRSPVAVPVEAEVPAPAPSLELAGVASGGGGLASPGRTTVAFDRSEPLPPERRPLPPADDRPTRRHATIGLAPERIAQRIADRARDVYGLRNTIAAPLQTPDGVVGAIVLSRRVADQWPESAQRLLAGAADEAARALTRATQQRDAEARATTDALTGLPNRRYFEEFTGLLARRRRADDALGVLIVDIDHFKRVNDTHGHGVGDEVLRAVGGAIVGAVREDDVPVRFGGEEFAVLLRNPSREVAIEVAERVRVAVSRLDLTTFGVSGVTASVGVAVAVAADQPIPDLVASADRALYAAKRGGRDRVVAAG